MPRCRLRRSLLASLAATAWLGACESERILHGGGAAGDGGAPPSLQVSGPVQGAGGHTPPPAAKVVAMWTVEEYLQGRRHQKFGEGTATADRFTLTFAQAPPAAALAGGKVGVGVLYLVPAGTAIADGPVDDNAIRSVALGAAGSYGIVYRAQGATTPSWITAFGEGYGCGIGVSRGGTELESFAPTSCTDVRIEVNELASIRFVDWQ